MIKICNGGKIHCNQEKDISEFYFRKDSNEYRTWCKKCENLRKKKYYSNLENKIKKQKYNKQYYLDNKEDILLFQKQYNNKSKNKERISRYQYIYRNKSKNKIKKQQYGKEYNSKLEIKERRSEKYKLRKKTDISFKLKSYMSSSISDSLKFNKQGNHWENLVGYTTEDFKQHLKSQFEPWMSWDNYGKPKNNEKTWSIDHIIPISSYDITNYDCNDFKKCWSLNNLRPLEYIKNISKFNKLDLDLIYRNNILDLLPDNILNQLED